MATSFDPVRLGGGRGRRPDRGLLAALLVLGFLGLALTKPWELGGEGGTTAIRSPAPGSASLFPAPTASIDSPAAAGAGARPTVPARTQVVPAASWVEVEPELRLHARWGVRALVDRPGGGLMERWEPSGPPVVSASAPVAAEGGRAGPPSAGVLLETAGRPIRVLGVTAPANETPLDIRVWWLTRGAEPRWLDVRPVDPAVAGGHLLLLPPRRADGTAPSWPPGRYRLDLLVGGAVARMTVVLPPPGAAADARDGDPFATAADPPEPGGASPVHPFRADLGGLEAGAFVVADGVAVNVPARMADRLDERGAWLEAAAWRDRLPGAVADVWLPDLGGLGIMLAPEARLEWASLERIAPSPLVGVDAVSRSIVDSRGGSPGVVFAPPDGRAWLPGTYALDVRYLEAGFRRAGSHHVTVRPAPIRRTGALTSAVRAWAPSAGEWSILTGLAAPLDGGPVDAATRRWPQAPGSAAVDPVALGPDCAGGARIGQRSTFGLGHPASLVPRSIRLERLFERGRSLEVPIQASVAVVPGLSVITGAPEQPLAEGFYRLVVDEGPAAAGLVVCVGPDDRTPDAIDPASASDAAFADAAATAGSE